MALLKKEYYRANETLWLARNLIGKALFTCVEPGKTCAGLITETEAYLGPADRASHAWNNRRTHRTETIFLDGGIAYVYLCYGIHHLFNIVTNKPEIPHAILIRGIKIIEGHELMNQRYGKKLPEWLNGPGIVTRALGIKTCHDRVSLTGNTIWLEDHGDQFQGKEIITGPRVGIDYAGDDALLPWRFMLNHDSFR